MIHQPRRRTKALARPAFSKAASIQLRVRGKSSNRRYARMKIGIDTHEIGLAVDYIRDTLKKKRIKSQEIIRATMCAEEVISCMISHCPKPEAKISVRVRSFLGNTEIRISCVGTAFDISEIREAETVRMDYADEAANEAFRSLFDR